MKALPKKLRKNRFEYDLIKRGKQTLLYRQNVSTDVKRFEVFRIRIREAVTIFEVDYPKKEIFPGNEDFGDWAFCCWDLEAAEIKFKELERQRRN